MKNCLLVFWNYNFEKVLEDLFYLKFMHFYPNYIYDKDKDG